MPSEHFHTKHQGPASYEATSAADLILPAADALPRNLKEDPIQFENLGTRSTKYNSPGVDPENPYNAFAAEAISSPEAAEQEPDVHPRVVEEMAKGIDSVESKNQSQDAQIDALNETISAQDKKIDELMEMVKDLQNRLPKTAEAESVVEEGAPTEEVTAEAETAPAELENEMAAEVVPEGEETGDVVEAELVDDEKPGTDMELYKPGTDLELFKGPQFPAELFEAYGEATDNYAELTAKHRNGYIGHFLRNSKFLVKIPGLKWLAEKVNNIAEKPLTEARTEYQSVVTKMQDEIANSFRDIEPSEERQEALRIDTGLFALESAMALESRIVEKRAEASPATNKFVDWWVKQEGWKGKLKKAAIVGGTGVAIGLGMGLLALPATAAILAGGASGLLIANHVTKRRANAERGEDQTLASEQSTADREAMEARYAELSDDGKYVRAEDLTSVVEDRTAAEKRGNRNRAKSAAAVGTASASLGFAGGSAIRSAIDGASAVPDASAGRGVAEAEPGSKVVGEAPAPTPETPPAPEILGNNFTVESGNGYINELMEFASTNGKGLDVYQAEQLHNDILANFGQQYSSMPTYVEGADVRLAFSGDAAWNPGVKEFAQNWMASRGLW